VIHHEQLLKDARPYIRVLLAALPDASPGRGLPEVSLMDDPPDPCNAGEEHQVVCHLTR